MAAYTLVVPFLTDNPHFAHGVEFGLLYARMKPDSGENVIADYCTLWNQDHVTLLANRLGWRVVEMKPWEGGDWFWCKMERIAGT